MIENNSGQITIIPDNNQVNFQDINQTITVTDNISNTVIDVIQPTTQVVQVLTGPMGAPGASGALPTSGSLNLTGSINVSGSVSANNFNGGTFSGSFIGLFTGSFTGSLQGTSSWAQTALVALSSQTASYVQSSSYAETASYASQALSSSYALTASYVQNAQTASYVLNAVSSSFATTASYIQTASYAISSSYAITASHALNIPVTASYALQALSSSYALTASYASNVPLTSSYAISASQAVSASYATTASYVNLAQTASYITTAQTASYVLNAVSSSQSTTASYALTASYVANASSFPFTGSAIITGSLVVTGSINTTNGLYAQTISASNGITGSLLGTASFVTGSIFTNSNIAASASYSTFALTAGNGGVTKIIAGPNVGISPVNGLGDVTVTAFGNNSYNTATGSYGSFYDTGSVIATSATTIYSMSLSTTDISNGVFVSASNGDVTRVKFTNAGVYNIQFSAQFSNSDNATQDTVVWLRKNGTDIPDSSGTVGVPPFKAGSNGQVIVSWNYYVPISANDFIQLYWHSEQANVITLETIAAGTSPTYPRTPSTILTATRVDTFLSNTGSFSGSFTGTFNGTITSASYAQTASYVLNAVSASYVTTASYATQALSASYAPSTPTFPYTGSAIITGSLSVTGTTIAGFNPTPRTGSIRDGVTSVLGDLQDWNDKYHSGEVLYNEVALEAIAFGQLVTRSGGGWYLANATDTSFSTSMLGICLYPASENDPTSILINGFVSIDTAYVNEFKMGLPMYMSATTAGNIDTDAPTTAGNVVRIIGYTFWDTGNQANGKYILRFTPDNTWIEL
jgi:hypothetical protein